jgi:tetratricopeptide (TPR) repeat protein
MKIRLLLLGFSLFALVGNLGAQSKIEKLYGQKRYAEVIAFAPQAASLSGPDLFTIGQAYLQQQDDANAVLFFDKSIAKGHKNGEVYFARGVAQSNLEMYDEAAASYRQALFYMPGRKKVLIELAANYYQADNLDSAYNVYARIEKNWGDYYPALLMTCQILHEQEYYDKALDCYYSKLYVLKKSPTYHREALEDVVRLEWHYAKNYVKAEAALKNLMSDYPDDYGYTMQMLQLYNFTGRYADAMLLENRILEGYVALKLPQTYYENGAMVVEQFDSAQYTIEAYRNFQPEKQGNEVYKSFVFSRPGNRPLGKISGVAMPDTAYIMGYSLDSAAALPTNFNYEMYKASLLNALFAPPPAPIDSIPAE